MLPDEMFGKVMSIPDELMVKYFRLCTSVPVDEVEAIESALAAGTEHPNLVKRRLGREIVMLYHGAEADAWRRRRSIASSSDTRRPTDIPDVEVELGDEVYVPRLLQQLGLAASAGEGRRLIDQGGVKLDGTPWSPPYIRARVRASKEL